MRAFAVLTKRVFHRVNSFFRMMPVSMTIAALREALRIIEIDRGVTQADQEVVQEVVQGVVQGVDQEVVQGVVIDAATENIHTTVRVACLIPSISFIPFFISQR